MRTLNAAQRGATSRLLPLMTELTARLDAVLSSWRWRIGNLIGSSFGFAFRRPIKSLSANRIRMICDKYEQWKSIAHTPSAELTEGDAYQLEVWMRDLEQDFRSLTSSRRWRVGNAIVTAARALLLRPRVSMSTSQIDELFQQHVRTREDDRPHLPVQRFSLADLYYHLGFVREKAKQWALAAEAYEEALKLCPPRPGQYYRLGRVRGHQKRWKEASHAYQEAVRRNPTQSHWFFQLGKACQMSQKWDDALQAYRRAIELDPTHATWFYRLGQVCERQNRWDEAVTSYEAAVRLDASRADWFFQLGQAYEKIAVATPVYLPQVGLRLRKQGDWRSAARAYTAALALSDSEPLYHFRLGHVCEKMRDFDGAASYFEVAVRLRPGRPGWLYRLARAREQSLDLEGALTTYQALLTLKPKHSRAQARAYSILVKLARWSEAAQNALDSADQMEMRARPRPIALVSATAEATIDRLEALLTSDDFPVSQVGALQLLKEARDVDVAGTLPLNWWFALHWRLINKGWFSLAYEVKDIAASLMVLRPTKLESVGLARYLSVAKALVQLGRKDAALDHLEPLLHGNNETRMAAWQLIADIEALYGKFANLSEVLRVHEEVNLPVAEAAFREAVRDRTIAIVGPVLNGMANGEEIDSYDVIVRTNFVPHSLDSVRALCLGSRTDISYCNGIAWQMLNREIREAVEGAKLKMVVLRPFNYVHDQRLIARPGDLRYNPAESTALLRARSFGVQRILHDVLRYGPRSVKVFNIDFFLSSGSYKKGYTAGELLADVDPYYLGSGHDYRGDFLFTKHLRDQSVISTDPRIGKLLDFSPGQYLAAMDGNQVSASDSDLSSLRATGR